MPDPLAGAPRTDAVVHVHLQEGFAEDRVEVHVGDALALDGAEVTTSLLTGLAAEATARVAAGRVKVRVAVPTRGLTGEHVVRVPAGGQRWVGVSIEAGRPQFMESTAPLFYG